MLRSECEMWVLGGGHVVWVGCWDVEYGWLRVDPFYSLQSVVGKMVVVSKSWRYVGTICRGV
jgi:hypothetical protein